MGSLERLFDPRGIAVVGASTDASRPGNQTLVALRANGYAGGVYPVNPKYPEIAGYRCHASLGEIDGDCDVAVIALPARQVAGVLRDCAARGIGHAVVLGGGFREGGADGSALESGLVAAARDCGVRFIGPNCLGLVNVHVRAYAAWGSLTRPPLLAPGPVSVVLQSASFGMSVVIQAAQAGIGFRHVVTSGNEADVSTPEIIDAYVDDPHTKVILSYLEGVSDGRAFMAAARRALAAGKPLVVIKAGNTEQGRRAAQSHTANMTGSYDVYRAAFRQCGVIEVDDVPDAVDAVACLLGGRLPAGNRVGVIGGSGGAAAMFSDQADLSGLEMPAFRETTVDALAASLPPMSVLRNPVDYTAGFPRRQEGLDFERAFRAVIDDPDVDQLAVMFAAAGRRQVEYGGEVLGRLAASSTKPIVVFSGMDEGLAPEGLDLLRRAGVPVLSSPKRVAVAMARIAAHAQARRLHASRPGTGPVAGGDGPGLLQEASAAVRGPLDEVASKRLLASFGLPVSGDRVLPLEPVADDLAGLGWPVVLKIVSPDIAHKSDVGGVRLGIGGPDALLQAARRMVAEVREARPDARLSGLLVAPMVSGALETIVGVVNDPAFGPVVAFGLGGVLAEVLHDVSYRVAPFDVVEARSMVADLRARALFDGVRGGVPLDIDALVEALAKVSTLAWCLRDRLHELDINPLLVRPTGQGVIAVDALAVMRSP
jgi:acetate---CoA ligase (ADP-forming)